MLTLPAIFERMLVPEHGDLPPDLANYILKLDFSPLEHARVQELSLKAQAGTLSGSERADLDALIAAETVLIVMRAKAHASLQRQAPAA